MLLKDVVVIPPKDSPEHANTEVDWIVDQGAGAKQLHDGINPQVFMRNLLI